MPETSSRSTGCREMSQNLQDRVPVTMATRRMAAILNSPPIIRNSARASGVQQATPASRGVTKPERIRGQLNDQP